MQLSLETNRTDHKTILKLTPETPEEQKLLHLLDGEKLIVGRLESPAHGYLMANPPYLKPALTQPSSAFVVKPTVSAKPSTPSSRRR